MVAKIRSLLIPIVSLCSILGISFAIIAYGRGYRLDITKNTVRSTGLISATSDPIGAQVFVDGKLKTATNNSFPIDPGRYTVTIAKEGYISWQKQLRVQGEIVSRADAFLFPTNPSLTPITTLGIRNPSLSPDGSKIAFTIPNGHLDSAYSAKAGLWVYELSEGPLGRNRDPQQIAPTDAAFDVTGAALTWSPDATQILAVSQTLESRLYQVNRPGAYQNMTLSYQTVLKTWQGEQSATSTQKLQAFPQPVIDVATRSAQLISLSPDETKLLYQATASATIPNIIEPPLIGINPTEEHRSISPGNIYVYDSKEDKNYLVLAQTELPKLTPSPIRSKNRSVTPSPLLTSHFSLLTSFVHWFPTSNHLLLTLGNKIDVMEYDRTNWVTVYSGPFADNFVTPWTNGSRIIILTNLNADATALPNLYTVNLR